MASRILLINANRCVFPERVFPLGLTYLQAALRPAGHECRWLDLLDQGDQMDAVFESFRPEYVGISVRNIDDVIIRKQETFFDDLPALGAAIRRRAGCPVIVGGSGFSIFPKELLELSEADFGIVGEGESSFPELLRCLEAGSSYEDVPGLVFRKDGHLVLNPPAARPLRSDMITGDRPAAVATRYLASSGVLNVQTQRGCAYRCCYCTYPVVEGRSHRRQPAELVAEELAQLERLDAKYAFIVDSVFNSSNHHVAEICEAILRRGVKISWSCFLRPQGLTADLMRLMVRAGLAHVEFGSDSFCDEVLEAYQKGFTFDDIRQSTELAQQTNVGCCHYFIAGGPGETAATLRQSFAHAEHLKPATILAVVGMRIYPGTALHDRAVAERQLQSEDNLLVPRYYLAPGLKQETVFEQLRKVAGRSPNWVVGDPVPAYIQLVERLRRRGVVGPLWSYFSAMQRLWPQATGGGGQP